MTTTRKPIRRTLAAALAAFTLAGCGTGTLSAPGEQPASFAQTDAQRRARIRLQLAIGYFEQRQMAIALDEIKQALASDPDLADAYSVRALIYMNMGETGSAEDNFLRALKLAPNNPDINNNYGWFLCQNGRPEKAIAYFEAALNVKSYQSPSKALNNAGVCSLKSKDTVAAERYFSRAFQFDPADPVTNTNMARMYYDKREYERARFYMGRALKADQLSADTLWLAIRIERKLGDRTAEKSLAVQLLRRHPGSPEAASYQRGGFDD